MMPARQHALLATTVVSMVTMVACAPERFRPSKIDYGLVTPDGASSALRSPKELATPKGHGERFAKASEPAPPPAGTIQLQAVIESVTNRYPPYLSALLERDLASGRLIRPFDPSLDLALDVGIFFVCLPESLERPAVAAFRDWVLAEVAAGSRRARA